MDNNRLFVGGISWGVRDDALQAAFEKAGTVVSAVVIMDRMSGRSKGFGFVEMATAEERDAAIEMWNEKELDGRQIIVNIAKPREDRG